MGANWDSAPTEWDQEREPCNQTWVLTACQEKYAQLQQYLALSSTQDEPAAVYVRWVSTKNAAQWVNSFETRQNSNGARGSSSERATQIESERGFEGSGWSNRETPSQNYDGWEIGKTVAATGSYLYQEAPCRPQRAPLEARSSHGAEQESPMAPAEDSRPGSSGLSCMNNS